MCYVVCVHNVAAMYMIASGEGYRQGVDLRCQEMHGSITNSLFFYYVGGLTTKISTLFKGFPKDSPCIVSCARLASPFVIACASLGVVTWVNRQRNCMRLKHAKEGLNEYFQVRKAKPQQGNKSGCNPACSQLQCSPKAGSAREGGNGPAKSINASA
jgi:hypothetical protein